MVKKIFTIIVSIIFLTSCAVKTPEELIEPPEVDDNKKQILSLVNSFIPANSEVLDLGSGTIDSANSDSFASEMEGEQNEIFVMYRNKNTREIGIFILAYDGMIWDKKLEKNLESTDVSDYSIIDLNNDGKKEIVIGYFEDISKRLIIIGNVNKEYKILYSEKYLAFNIAKEEENYMLAISTPFETQNSNKFSILKYDGENVFEWANKVYDSDVEIYKIEYGNINENEKAYVLDNYKDVYLGSVDVLKLENRSLVSIVPKENVGYFNQEFLTSSSDINNDGIIDISGNEILTNRESNHGIILNRYYNFNDDREIKLLKSVYEDHHSSISVDVKKFPTNKLYIDKLDDKSLKIYYIDNNTTEWKILELMNKDINTDEYDSSEYEKILEKNNEVIIAKYEQKNDLVGEDRKNFDEIYNILRNNEEAIKFLE